LKTGIRNAGGMKFSVVYEEMNEHKAVDVEIQNVVYGQMLPGEMQNVECRM